MLKSSLAAVEGAGRRACAVFCKSVMAASLLTCSTLASALGLGEITLHSALNQPLNAEIQLLETAGLSNEDVVARLASPEAFAKAGIERVFFLNDLRFTPVLRGDRGVIRVVSSKPVTEPYLSFLVQLARPNGDLLHEYTLLLDPATSAQGLAATRSRNSQRMTASAQESRMPVAPPAAVQGKHYTVANGDTLNGIASRLQGPGNKVSASQLADGIRLLNPQVFAAGAGAGLKVGQDLLLPDSAVLPTAAAAAASPAAPPPQPAELQRTAEQLSAAAIENQQLVQSLEALKAQTQELQEQMSGKDKQITALRSDLAAAQSAARPAAPATPPATPVQPAVAVTPSSDSFLSLPILLAVVLIMLLLAALVYSRRRQRKQFAAPAFAASAADDQLIKPAQAAMLPVFEVPAVAPQPVPQTPPTPAPAKAAATQRPAGAVPDALDGVSIYIAYGRFTEAMGILRSALEKQPERDDIRIRLLELLAEQGDGSGFVREEQSALEHGVDPQTIQDIRDRFPQLKAAEVAPATPVIPVVAAAATAVSFEKTEPEPAAYLQPDLEPEPAAQLDETAAAALNPQHADEFQLNLDDLSMDADWDLVDPFDSPPPRPKPAVAEPAPAEVDPGFSSDLTQLPEVFELSDEQFLSDFSEPDVIEPIEVVAPAAVDDLSDDFLDSFMSDDAEFDLLDLEEPPLSQINQAQVLIEEGDLESAREILQQVIAESDEEHRRMARELLAGIS
ncbi:MULTISPECIES: FimV/HubP family polar landmark protein [Pseudomonas syringae group]|nr:FimV/HubP family polar landmark protein [Pseudomonas syringae group genomosp. 7]